LPFFPSQSNGFLPLLFEERVLFCYPRPSGERVRVRGKLDNFIKKGSGEEEKKLYVTGAPLY